MISRSLVACVLCVFLAAAPWIVSAETFALQDKSCLRKMQIVRHYEIPANKNGATVAFLPALLSFWGATNWQIIKSSKFTYSEQPNKIETTADNLGKLRRNYLLVWDAAKGDKITVDQTMDVELTCFNTLYTTAKLPYDDAVLKRFPSSLGADEKQGINPKNPDLGPICDPILKKARTAEEAVEGVCDWINENIKFVITDKTPDESLAQRQGCCGQMSFIACSMLRRMGIPAEEVGAKFIGSDKSGHAFIEVYFPDAGWVFYDLSNLNRGYKSLDCLMTAGWGYRSGTPDNTAWTNGYFCVEKDAPSYKERSDTSSSKIIRKGTKGMKICSVTVAAQKPPATVKIRQRPINDLIMDTSVPPGPREYTDNALESPAKDAKAAVPGEQAK